MSMEDEDIELPPPLSSFDNASEGKKLQKPRKDKGKGRAREDGQDLSASGARAMLGGEPDTSTIQGAAIARLANGGPNGLDSASSSDFALVKSTMRLPLAPVFAEDPLEGVRQSLESWIMRYLPSIDAVLLTISWPPEFLQDNAVLTPSSAFGMARVRWEGVGFRPQVGSTSTGKLSLATPSVISLLLHNLFNASIAAEHISQDVYEWDPDATLPYSLAPTPMSRAITKPKAAAATPKSQGKKTRFGEDGVEGKSQTKDDSIPGEDAPPEEQGEEEDAHLEDEEALDGLGTETGCWVNRSTREPLGGTDGRISFTVIGLTIANSMISVHGSLLPDPSVVFRQKEKEKERAKQREQEKKGGAKANQTPNENPKSGKKRRREA